MGIILPLALSDGTPEQLQKLQTKTVHAQILWIEKNIKKSFQKFVVKEMLVEENAREESFRYLRKLPRAYLLSGYANFKFYE